MRDPRRDRNKRKAVPVRLFYPSSKIRPITRHKETNNVFDTKLPRTPVDVLITRLPLLPSSHPFSFSLPSPPPFPYRVLTSLFDSAVNARESVGTTGDIGPQPPRKKDESEPRHSWIDFEPGRVSLFSALSRLRPHSHWLIPLVPGYTRTG